MKIRSAGFTLVEIMVVLGVMAILFAAMMSMMSYSSRATQSTTASNDFNGLVNTLDSVLANSVTCQGLLQGIILQNTPPPQILPLATPLALNGVPLWTYQGGKAMYGSTIQILQLELTSPTNAATWTATSAATPDQFQVNLVLNASKVVGGGGAVGGSLLSKTFYLIVNTAGGAGTAINGCAAQANYWTAEIPPNQNSIYNTNSGNVGIGTSAPALLLDVAGAVRPQGPPSGTTCSAATEGALAYNKSVTPHVMQYCGCPTPSTCAWTSFGSDIVGQSIGSPGYVLFSNGLQIAWGQSTTPGTPPYLASSGYTWDSVSLAASFTSIWSITATVIPSTTTWGHLEPNGNVPYSILVSAPTSNSFQAACIALSSGGAGNFTTNFLKAVTFSYLVIGQGSTTP